MIGETILHYKIIEKLGEGGMGVVYKAEDTELKRFVALKFLPTHFASSPEDFSRLKQEAQSAAILNHPNICIIYAFEAERDRRFISMEYMDGITLRQKIADAPLSIHEALTYAIQIGEALREAHINGILHRDIKTENIMINSQNQIKVMDFGIARFKDNLIDTGFKSTYGTLSYMSPEQALNNPSSYPADIWSFGVVCYEMFTGRLPFLHDYEAAIIYSILSEEPLPPSRIRPEIPPEMEHIILKCIMKDEEERYSNMHEIVGELTQLKKDLESRTVRENYNREQIKKLKKPTEQKQATIVYIKIQNYSELIEHTGQEDIVIILEKYYKIINIATSKYAGTVNKTVTSDAVLYFGLPESIENSAQKAIGAIIEIKREFESFLRGYKIPDKFKLNIGASSGTVIAGSIPSGEKLEYTVIGDAVETAAKLIETASDGQILIESITFKALKNYFNFKSVKPVSIKGKRDPIKVYELNTSRINLKSDLSMEQRLIESVIVGRTSELDKLEYLLLKAINGEGSIVGIIAEAGIGKSRLINEFKKKNIFQRVTLLEGKSEFTDKNVGYHPIVDILKQWINITENDNEVQAFSKLENTVINLCGEEAKEIIPFVATLMGFKLNGEYASRLGEVSPDAMKKLIQKSMRQLVMKGSEINPLVIIMEDLHWADLSSIELLLSLFRLAENKRLFFVNTLRPNYAETGERIISAVREKYYGFYTEVKLNPLGIKDRQTLVQNLLKIPQLPAHIEKAITSATEGNPFFIEEVIRTLIYDNIIEIKNGQFIISKDIGNIVIPGSVKEVLLARIDKLDESSKYILKVASVIGRYFLYDILKKVAEEIDDIDTHIGTLINLELIKENIYGNEREYLFRHALAQEAVYETMLAKDRRNLHLKVASAIENIYAGKIGDFYELLAHHYSIADDKEKAEKYLIKAGERTLKNAASSEALNYFEEALKLYLQKYGKGVDKEKIFMFEKNIGISFYNKGYFVDSVEHFKNALQFAGIKTDRSNAGELFRLAYNFFLIAADLYLPLKVPKSSPTEKDYELFDLLFKIANSYAQYDGKKMFLELLNLTRLKTGFKLKAEEGLDTYSFGSSLFTYSGISFPLGRKFLEKANQIAELNGLKELYSYGYDETIYTCLSGNWKNFGKINEKLLGIQLRSGDLFKAIYQISWALYMVINRGDYDYAQYLIDKGNEISESFDFDYGRLYMLSFKADLNLNRRNLLKTVKYYDESCELAEKLGLNSWILGLSGKRAKAFILLNDLPSAKDSLSKAEKAMKESDSLTPMLLSYFNECKLFYFVTLYGNSMKENPQQSEKITSLEKEIIKYKKNAVKISNKVAEIKPAVDRYMGIYYWRKKKFRNAIKYFRQSISFAEHLGAMPELGRSYLEFGRFLSDSAVDIKDMEPEKYFSKAEYIFNKYDLKWDKEELKKIRNVAAK